MVHKKGDKVDFGDIAGSKKTHIELFVRRELRNRRGPLPQAELIALITVEYNCSYWSAHTRLVKLIKEKPNTFGIWKVGQTRHNEIFLKRGL